MVSPRFTGVLGWLLLVGLGLGLSGCDERLPGFADPPPYDAGSVQDAGEDDDAG